MSVRLCGSTAREGSFRKRFASATPGDCEDTELTAGSAWPANPLSASHEKRERRGIPDIRSGADSLPLDPAKEDELISDAKISVRR